VCLGEVQLTYKRACADRRVSHDRSGAVGWPALRLYSPHGTHMGEDGHGSGECSHRVQTQGFGRSMCRALASMLN
jgi:hypothetical protein